MLTLVVVAGVPVGGTDDRQGCAHAAEIDTWRAYLTPRRMRTVRHYPVTLAHFARMCWRAFRRAPAYARRLPLTNLAAMHHYWPHD